MASRIQLSKEEASLMMSPPLKQDALRIGDGIRLVVERSQKGRAGKQQHSLDYAQIVAMYSSSRGERMLRVRWIYRRAEVVNLCRVSRAFLAKLRDCDLTLTNHEDNEIPVESVRALWRPSAEQPIRYRVETETGHVASIGEEDRRQNRRLWPIVNARRKGKLNKNNNSDNDDDKAASSEPAASRSSLSGSDKKKSRKRKRRGHGRDAMSSKQALENAHRRAAQMKIGQYVDTSSPEDKNHCNLNFLQNVAKLLLGKDEVLARAKQLGDGNYLDVGFGRRFEEREQQKQQLQHQDGDDNVDASADAKPARQPVLFGLITSVGDGKRKRTPVIMFLDGPKLGTTGYFDRYGICRSWLHVPNGYQYHEILRKSHIGKLTLTHEMAHDWLVRRRMQPESVDGIYLDLMGGFFGNVDQDPKEDLRLMFAHRVLRKSTDPHGKAPGSILALEFNTRPQDPDNNYRSSVDGKCMEVMAYVQQVAAEHGYRAHAVNAIRYAQMWYLLFEIY